MPTYQYSCTECGHFFEQFQSFSEESLTVCPQCDGRLRKVFNAVGVVFKGSGFYRTDSRTDSRTPGGDATKPATEGSTAKGGSETTSSSTSSTSDSSAGTTKSSTTSGSAA